jgi:VCBS repeat-containing protein
MWTLDNPPRKSSRPAPTSAEGYGTYEVTSAGDWTYTLNNSHSAVQELGVGATLSDYITVTSADGSNSQIVTVRIDGTNDTPEITAEVGTPTLVDTSVNDSFADLTGQLDATDRDTGASLSYALAALEDGVGAYGTLSVGTDGSYTFVADAAAINALQSGSFFDVFNVTVSDGLGGSASTTVTINVTAGNDTPEITAEVGTPTLVDTSVNDSFADLTGQLDATDRDTGASLSYALAALEDGVGAYGTLSVGTDGSYTFVADAAAINALQSGNYSDVFNVTVSDGLGGSASTTVTINVTAGNDTPEITAEVGTPTLVDTSVNDSFADLTGQLDATDRDTGASLSYALAALEDGVGAYGTLSVGTDGSYTFVADAAAINALQSGNYSDVFNVTVSDGLGGSASTTVTINVTAGNDTPEITAEVGTPTLVDTSVNDSFADLTGQLDATDRDTGASLSYALAALEDGVGAYGTLSVGTDGSYTFVADAAAINALQSGSFFDVFNVTVSDGLGGSASTTVTINVTAGNDTPEITAEVGTPTLVDTSVNDSFADLTGQLDATDRDTGASLSYALAALEDGVGAYGTLSVGTDGSYTFVADAAAINALQSGSFFDVFNVTVSDGLGGSASTTVTINVTAGNDTPEITAEVGTPTLVDTSVNDSFADLTGQLDATDRDTGASLSYALAALEDGVGAYGTLSVGTDGSYTFVADAAAINALQSGNYSDVFNVTVSDGLGGSASTTVTINVTAGNDTPEITAEVGTPTLVDTSVNDSFADLTGQLDATDRDTGASLSYALAALEDGVGAYGTLSVGTDGSYTFVADAAAINALQSGNYSDVFNVTVSDGLGGSASTTVTINVTAGNDTPEITAEVGTPTLVDTSVNDSFANLTGQLDATDRDTGASLSYALAALEDGVGAYGTLSVGTDGSYTFVADAAAINALQSGNYSDVFNVTVSDGLGGSASTTVTINVTAGNDTPEITAEVGTPTLVDTSVNDSFADLTGQLDATDRDTGASLSYALAALEDGVGAYGTLSVGTDGSYTFVADAAAINALQSGNYSDVFNVTVSDGLGGSASTTVTINVTAGNDTPEITAEVGTPTLVDTSVNDSFADLTGQLDATDRDTGASLSYALAALEDGVGAYGTLSVGTDGSYTFVADAAAINALQSGNYSDVFNVTVSDGLGGSASTTVTINVTAGNDTPEITAEVGTPTLVDTSVNDSFADLTGQLDATDRDTGASLSYALAALEDGVGAYGTLSVGTDGSYTFVADAAAINALQSGNYSDVFNVTVSDGLGGSASTTVTINVTAGNDTPEITAEVGTPTLVDTSVNDSFADLTGQLDATDRDTGASLSYALAALEDGVGAYGTLSVGTDGSYTFVADAAAINALQSGNYSDVFNVTVSDGLGGSASTTVTINVTAGNDTPEITAEVGTPTLVDTSVNDSFADLTGQLDATDRDTGASLSYALAALEDGVGAYGTLSVGTDGSYTFVADAAAINALQSGNYSDVFDVTVSDGLGGSASTTVTINVTAGNDTPEITAEVGTPTLVDTSVNDSFADLTGQLDATDRDTGASLSYALAALEDGVGAYGTLSVGTDGSYTFVADAAAINALQSGNYSDVFNVTVSDGLGGSASTTVTINVTAGNDTPEITAEVGTPTLVDTSVNDSFADLTGQLDATDRDTGASLSYALAALEDGVGAYGTLSVGDGSYTFVADAAAINALQRQLQRRVQRHGLRRSGRQRQHHRDHQRHRRQRHARDHRRGGHPDPGRYQRERQLRRPHWSARRHRPRHWRQPELRPGGAGRRRGRLRHPERRHRRQLHLRGRRGGDQRPAERQLQRRVQRHGLRRSGRQRQHHRDHQRHRRQRHARDHRRGGHPDPGRYQRERQLRRPHRSARRHRPRHWRQPELRPGGAGRRRGRLRHPERRHRRQLHLRGRRGGDQRPAERQLQRRVQRHGLRRSGRQRQHHRDHQRHRRQRHARDHRRGGHPDPGRYQRERQLRRPHRSARRHRPRHWRQPELRPGGAGRRRGRLRHPERRHRRQLHLRGRRGGDQRPAERQLQRRVQRHGLRRSGRQRQHHRDHQRHRRQRHARDHRRGGHPDPGRYQRERQLRRPHWSARRHRPRHWRQPELRPGGAGRRRGRLRHPERRHRRQLHLRGRRGGDQRPAERQLQRRVQRHGLRRSGRQRQHHRDHQRHRRQRHARDHRRGGHPDPGRYQRERQLRRPHWSARRHRPRHWRQPELRPGGAGRRRGRLRHPERRHRRQLHLRGRRGGDQRPAERQLQRRVQRHGLRRSGRQRQHHRDHQRHRRQRHARDHRRGWAPRPWSIPA